ncbi:phage tail assembly protein [Moraxella sp. ZY210820]|uniref:phage tail assembly protein n=1 Tax=unclassified Moraxella TaxID=2685852 RepID=UPI0027302F61|nr:phage tail assembly protein [Moraxella sp. ZY210820]WLF84490.1 phage tail assembly protein [Moraxella sp. ZY210820]
MNEQANNTLPIENPDVVNVGFDDGFKRGNDTIKTVQLNKPKTGALRGLSLSNVIQMDVDSLAKLATRITVPTMTEQDVYNLSPADFTTLGVAMIGFFVSNSNSPAV